jgi:hypothetical protein
MTTLKTDCKRFIDLHEGQYACEINIPKCKDCPHYEPEEEPPTPSEPEEYEEPPF